MNLQAEYAPYDFVIDPGTFGLRHRVVETRFGALDVYATGRGRREVLVLMHGLNGSWQSWTPLLTYASRSQAAVLDTYDLVVIDMRRLDVPTNAAELQDMGDVIRRDLSGYMGMHLFGHSTGGSLALSMAARWPAEVRSVRLISGAFVTLCEEVQTRRPHPFAPAGPRQAMGQFRVFARLGPFVPLALAAAARVGVLSKLASGLYDNSAALPPRIIDSIRLNYSGRTLRRTIAMGRSYPFADIYPRVKAPVIAVAGRTDPLIDERDNTRLSEWISDYTFVTIDGAGHFAHIERPAAASKVLLQGL